MSKTYYIQFGLAESREDHATLSWGETGEEALAFLKSWMEFDNNMGHGFDPDAVYYWIIREATTKDIYDFYFSEEDPEDVLADIEYDRWEANQLELADMCF